MEEKVDTRNENLHINYTKINNLLDMMAVPYIGIYSPNYTLMSPLNVFYKKAISKQTYNLFPDSLKKHLLELTAEIELENFIVTLDGSFLNPSNHKTEFLRLNFVPHPYIFYDVTNLNKDHVTFIFSSLYTDDPYHQGYFQETNESDGLKINPEQFFTDQNKKEIILHKSNDNFPALSPNNCAFLVNPNQSFLTFYNFTAVTYMNKIVKCAVIQYNVFNRNDILAMSPILDCFNFTKVEKINDVYNFISNLFSAKENLKNIFYYLYFHISKNFIGLDKKHKIDNKEFIKNLFKALFYKKMNNCNYDVNLSLFQNNNLKKNSNLMIDDDMELCNFHYESVCYYIWCNMGRLVISDIGEEILKSSESLYLVDIIRKYLEYFFKRFDYLYSTLNVFFQEELSGRYSKIETKDEKIEKNLLEENILEQNYLKTKSKFLINRFTVDFIANFYNNFKNSEIAKKFQLHQLNIEQFCFVSEIPKENNRNKNLEIIREILEETFIENIFGILTKLNSLDLIYQKMIYYLVWVRKGQILGVHNNFGKMSMQRSNEIPSNYHCDQEEQVIILLDIISLIENFDSL